MTPQPDRSPHHTHALSAIQGALALTVLLLIVQMWLLTATLEAFLAGHDEAALPGALLSGVLFLACGALYVFVVRVDARARAPE